MEYLRAHFCCTKPLDEEGVLGLLHTLQQLKYRVGDPTLPLDQLASDVVRAPYGYARIDCRWAVRPDVYYEGYLATLWSNGPRYRVALEVAENAFFKGLSFEWWPHADQETYRAYKELLTAVIAHMRPELGVVGYEADFICPTGQGLCAQWGNYFSRSTLSSWPPGDEMQLRALADEALLLEDQGLLVFMHPNVSYGPRPPAHWDRLQAIDAILARNGLIS